MMNHKEAFQLYGIRRPLKWRRRMARNDNRQAARYGKWRQLILGSQTRWWEEGQSLLRLLPFVVRN